MRRTAGSAIHSPAAAELDAMTAEADLVIVLTGRRETSLFNVAIAYDRPAIADDRRVLGAEPISIETADLDLAREDIDG